MRLGEHSWEFPVFLAPMAGVTDQTFRSLCIGMGCDLTFTEMVSAKGLHYKGPKTNELLLPAENEDGYAVQIFGSEPDVMAAAARRLTDMLGPRLWEIDVNMGCPVHKVVANGDGSALMRDIPLAARIVEAVVRAVDIPVTVKFRKGWDDAHVNAVPFAAAMQESGAAAVTVHGRTRMQMYAGEADWEIIAQVKARLRIPVIGNGDIFCAQDALRMRKETGCDGVMAARGVLGNPWLFQQIKAALKGREVKEPTLRERMDVALKHARMEEESDPRRAAFKMRKHIAWYMKGFAGAAELRAQVNRCTTVAEIETLMRDYWTKNGEKQAQLRG